MDGASSALVACYHPLKRSQTADGRSIIAKWHPIDALTEGLHIKIPCSQCKGCRLEKSRQWAVRIMHEAQMHEQNSFVTLTYDDEHLPDNDSLDVRHWQSFAKRLRHAAGKFRFYNCGEYGDETNRPHYHAILFGLAFLEDRKLIAGHSDTLFQSALLTKTWGKGHCSIGSVTTQSASYVARYAMKKRTGKLADKHYYGRKPEFSTMSRNPGIGSTWFDKYGSEVFPSDQVITNGHPHLPPKFYDLKLKASDPTAFEELMLSRARKAEPFKYNQTPERLAVREECATAKLTQLKRGL